MITHTLQHPSGASVSVSDYGAHVLSWTPAAGRDWLFLSQRAQFAEGKAIRGGVPVIFPQFNERGPWQRHGFARVTTWQRVEAGPDRLAFQLLSDAQTLKLWPYRFELGFEVELGESSLSMTLSVINRDAQDFEFTAALHTYFALQSLARASLDGLEGLMFWDNDGRPFNQRARADANILDFSDAIDRVYFDVAQPLSLKEQDRQLHIGMQGFREVVVWNPGQVAAASMQDLHPDEYRHMLCVEAAVIDQPIRLAPGERWVGSQILRNTTTFPLKINTMPASTPQPN
jgi:glucose-6-phosphate 1-epimerase